MRNLWVATKLCFYKWWIEKGREMTEEKKGGVGGGEEWVVIALNLLKEAKVFLLMGWKLKKNNVKRKEKYNSLYTLLGLYIRIKYIYNFLCYFEMLMT